MSASVSDVPNSVFIDILSRLPWKTICACKCVSKTWLDLMSDPFFAKLHIKRSPSSSIVMILGGYSHMRASLYDLQGENNLKRCRYLRMPEFEYGETFIIGTCNGLILFRRTVIHTDLLFVYNPIVQKKIKLPAMDERKNARKGRTSYGIGYSGVSDKYKVIKVMELSNRKRLAMVYVLGDWEDSWRKIENTPPTGSWWGDGGGVYVHGALYWFITQSPTVGSVCCFDVEREQFRLIPLPTPLEIFRAREHEFAEFIFQLDMMLEGIEPRYRHRIDSDIQLRVWGDDCISVCYWDRKQLNIYTIRVHEVEKSWSKGHAIESKHEICPLGKSRDGEVLLISGLERGYTRYFGPSDNHYPTCETLFAFHPERKTLEEVRRWVTCSTELVYAPSFLSPKHF